MTSAGLTFRITHAYGDPSVQTIRNDSIVAAISAIPLSTSREKVYRKMEQALRNRMGDN